MLPCHINGCLIVLPPNYSMRIKLQLIMLNLPNYQTGFSQKKLFHLLSFTSFEVELHFSGPEIYLNGYDIRGYYDRGNFAISLACLYWSVRSPSRNGRDGIKIVIGIDRYFSQLLVLLY